MKFLVAFALVMVAGVGAASTGSYTTKYDNINIDAILKNSRLVDNYVKCLLDKGRCNDEGRTLKEIIPDALKTDCAKCNDHQRANVEKIVRFLVQNRRQQFDELTAKYDPQGTYKSKYQKYLQ